MNHTILPLVLFALGMPATGLAEPSEVPAQAATPQAAPAQATTLPTKVPKGAQCLKLEGEVATRILSQLKLEKNGQSQPTLNIELRGLKTIQEAELWDLFIEKPKNLTFDQAAALLYHLDQLGIFASVRPILKISDDGKAATLDITVEEFPTVSKVFFNGAEGIAEKELWEKFKKGKDRDKKKKKDKDSACKPTAPSDWLAHREAGEFHPGVVYQGLDELYRRMEKHAHHRGFKLAQVKGVYAADGTLTIKVDEGHLGRVTIEGAHPRLLPELESLIDMRPGRVFLQGDVEAAGKRVASRFPFFNRSIQSTLDGDSLTLKLKTYRVRTTFGTSDLLRHTPVTSYAPGLQWTAWHYDPADRVHVAFDGLFNINTGRKSRTVDGGVLQEIGAKERFDFAGALRVAIPNFHIVELGATFHSLTDTADRWKMSPIDSYLYSFLMNRPESSYYRRTGYQFFVSSILLNHFLVGAEYRQDRFDSLPSLNKVFRLFRRGETVWQNPAIEDGTLGSLLFRLEYTTSHRNRQEIQSIHRDPERSLAPGAARSDRHALYQMLTTVEIARPSLGGDDSVRFAKLVTDHKVYLPIVSERQGIRLRLRGAGLLGDGHLPLQKQESLGGFTAVRGYDFGELGQGSFSWMGTVEYAFRGLSFFGDIGSVRVDNRWSTPKVGLGVAFGYKEVALIMAWRTDDQADVLPAARLLFQRNF